MRTTRAMNARAARTGVLRASGTARTSALPMTIALTGSLVLAGCSGAPSESDIKTAIERQVAAERQAIEGFAGKQAAAAANDMGPKLDSVHKIGCKEDGEKAYRCDVEVEVTMLGARNKHVAPMRFVKTSEGWQATN